VFSRNAHKSNDGEEKNINIFDRKDKDFTVNVYENILDVLRTGERDILNQKRVEKIQDFQISNPKWYELKDTDFYQEHKRNRLRGEINPKMENNLLKLMDDNLY
jgi:hypothetical protein